MEVGNTKKIFFIFRGFFTCEIHFFYDRSGLDFDSNLRIYYRISLLLKSRLVRKSYSKYANSSQNPNLIDRRKINLAGKNPRKSENIFRISNFHITQRKILDTLGALLSRTRRPVFFFGRFFTHLTAHVLLGA